MRAIVQRVRSATVTVSGSIVGKIEKGLMVLVAITEKDTDETIKWIGNKLANLRIFPDENDKMNLSVQDVKGNIMIVSNFTLYADVNRGFRPSFTESAHPSVSEPLYNKLIEFMRTNYSFRTESGIFGAMMDIELINDGPVTILIEK